ncbi:MAG: UDP-N-acetylmuramate--L-alanine ligase [Lachnospiraceae bacterium]|nr:UDP-N-acetylmuramate--L-alanine ligase [Lachnospiraceae bacterium]
MEKIDFIKPGAHVHFIGIGGISMSTLAELLIKKGYRISGSDMNPSELTGHLTSLGATINIGQRAENITGDIDLAVMTAAIHEDNPELMAVRKNNIPLMTRAQLLGQIMKLYKYPAAIAGAHGKTTVTSMVSELLINAEKDPTLSIGGFLPSIGSNFRLGNSEYFVTEACEYTNSFLEFFPGIEIILNIEADHLDFFKDLDDIRSSFRRFAALLPVDGTLIINGEIDNPEYITQDVTGRIITFGLKGDFDYTAGDITFEDGHPSFDLYKNGQKQERFTLGVFGEHNVYNALALIAFADSLEIDRGITQKTLAAFGGTQRRFELKGKKDGFTVVDDYAHHPTEIRATLSTALALPYNRVFCVFQPHTFTRTKAFMDDFANALALCDNVILAPIYPARETDDLGISSHTLAQCIISKGRNALCLDSFSEIENFLKKNLSQGDLLITMGAGDVYKIGENVLS